MEKERYVEKFYKMVKSRTLNNLKGVSTKNKKYFYKIDNAMNETDFLIGYNDWLINIKKLNHSIHVAKLLTILINMEEIKLKESDLKFYIKCALLHDLFKGENHHDNKAGEYLQKYLPATNKIQQRILEAVYYHSDKMYMHCNGKVDKLQAILLDADLLAKLIYPCCALKGMHEWSSFETLREHTSRFKDVSLKTCIENVYTTNCLYTKSAKKIYMLNRAKVNYIL